MNPSFEGPLGPSKTPPGWSPCGQGSSPDTQPGSWLVSHAAVDGASYLSLICRGSNVPFPDMWEKCGQQLDRPIRSGECYEIQVSLARSASFYAGSIYFNQPAIFRIWGGTALCTKTELLWESPTIEQTDWRLYATTFQAKGEHPFLIIETYFAQSGTYSGNVLIDNLTLRPCEPMSLEPSSTGKSGA
ncbi:MAG: hypothetical protein AAF399_08160 [Bacteroidota bacterium]